MAKSRRRMGPFQRIVFRFSQRLTVPEFDVRVTVPTRQDAARIRERLEAALQLIRLYAPLRYGYLRRDLPAILVGATHNLAECHDDVGICLLQYDYVVCDTTRPEQLALTLVHEGMHGRLTRAGFAYDEAHRARIERLCVGAELVMARRLPVAADMVVDAESRLAQPDAMWTDEALQEYRQRALRRAGMWGRIGYWIGRGLMAWNRRFPGAG